MKQRHILSIAAVLAAFTSLGAQAGVTTDSHGNVGYDTAAECDAAVLSGNAKFYQSFTHKPALVRNGEKTVRVMTLREAGYPNGACDIGVGHKAGRDGVSRALQGKYVPFGPDMLVNVYSNAAGEPVRMTMKQCDNWFSANKPRAVEFVRNVRTEPRPEVETPSMTAPVVAAVAAPVTAMAKKFGARPYVFGTLGGLYDGAKVDHVTVVKSDTDTRLAGQVGFGMQFNRYWGSELFYQGAQKHKYVAYDGDDRVRNHTYGARVTLGDNITDKFRLFGKAGIAGVKHSVSDFEHKLKTQARPTAGVGALYNLTDNLAVRADYDHVFKRGTQSYKNNLGQDITIKWKGTNYLGAGLQYNF